MAEQTRQLNFGGGQVGPSRASSTIGGTGTERGPVSALLDGLVALDKNQRALDRQRQEKEQASILAQQKADFKAFNESIELSIGSNIDRIALTDENNGAAIKTKGIAMIQGLVGSLRVSEPERIVYEQKAVNALNLKIQKANEGALKLRRSEQETIAADLKGQLIGQMDEAAKNIFSNNSGLRQSSQQDVLSLQAERLAPFLEVFTDPLTGEEKNLFSDERIATEMRTIKTETMSAGVAGWYEDSSSKALALKTLDTGQFKVGVPNATDPEKSTNVDVRDLLGEAWAPLRTRFTQQMASENKANAIRKAQEDGSMKVIQKENFKEDLLAIKDPEGQDVRPKTIEEILTMPPGWYADGDIGKLITAREKMNVVQDDDLELLLVFENMLDNDELIGDTLDKVATDPNLNMTNTTYLKFKARDAKLRNELLGISSGPTASFLADQEARLKDAYSPVGKNGSFDRNQAIKRNQALDELDQFIAEARETLSGRDLTEAVKEKRLELESRRAPGRQDSEILPLPIGMKRLEPVTLQSMRAGLSKLMDLRLKTPELIDKEVFENNIIEYARMKRVLMRREGAQAEVAKEPTGLKARREPK